RAVEASKQLSRSARRRSGRARARGARGPTTGPHARHRRAEPRVARAAGALLRQLGGERSLLRGEDRQDNLPPPPPLGAQAAAAAQSERTLMRRAVESDVCIVGSGITAAMVADRLSRTTNASIVVVEAGDDSVP